MTVPDYIPRLIRGNTNKPEDGGCLVQIANWLADPRLWTDRPVCVHRSLTTHAILINDALTDDQRHPLALLAPRLAGTAAVKRSIDMSVTHLTNKWVNANPLNLRYGPPPQLGPMKHHKGQFLFTTNARVDMDLTDAEATRAIDWLTRLINEFDRITNRHSTTDLPIATWRQIKELTHQ